MRKGKIETETKINIEIKLKMFEYLIFFDTVLVATFLFAPSPS